MNVTFLTVLTTAVLLAVPVVILLAGEKAERRRCRRFDRGYEANLRRRRPDLKL
jgi:hypothetical protein